MLHELSTTTKHAHKNKQHLKKRRPQQAKQLIKRMEQQKSKTNRMKTTRKKHTKQT